MHMGSRLMKSIRKNLFGVITLVLSAGVLLAFLFSSDGINSLKEISKTIQYHWLIWAILAAVMAWILEGFVLNMLCKVVYPEWKFRYSFCIGMVGVLYSALTPFSTGGQPMQIYSMHRLGMDTGAAGSIIAMKTLVYQVVLVLYSLVMVIWKLPFFQTNISGFSFLTIFGLVCNSTFIFLVLLFCISERFCSTKGYGFSINCTCVNIRTNGMKRYIVNCLFFTAAPFYLGNHGRSILERASLQLSKLRVPV